MKTYLAMIIASSAISFSSFSQETSPTVVAPGGGIAKGSSISLEWTLGEVATETLLSGKALYTQGFHQPVLVIEKAGAPENLIVKNKVSIFPNPASSVVNVLLHFVPKTPLSLTLFDNYGKILQIRQLPVKGSRFQLNIGGYAQGAYYLRIQSKDGSFLSNYNIIKTQ
ncbi:T9SS type A sorting domain-containing protein [Segetibacter sp. 3557_3]|uniref:T9SS type A sorting domain-containing protein n=1 Tax=Segetibacter sp. 3557_3 TaxID=2547429 RepID=UPI001404D2E0|nr:T9SS type A sorting domain-containing protein [Segetibacter sp. 3557_3]